MRKIRLASGDFSSSEFVDYYKGVVSVLEKSVKSRIGSKVKLPNVSEMNSISSDSVDAPRGSFVFEGVAYEQDKIPELKCSYSAFYIFDPSCSGYKGSYFNARFSVLLDCMDGYGLTEVLKMGIWEVTVDFYFGIDGKLLDTRVVVDR